MYFYDGGNMGFSSFISKDVRFQNETKRGVVTIRILYIITMFAFILDVLFAGINVVKRYPVRISLLVAGIVVLFINTYYLNTRINITLYLVFMFGFSLAMIPCFGWSAGMQNYFIVMLMVCFFAVHADLFFKIVLTAIVLCIRIATLFVFSGTLPETEISEVSGKLIQSSNITAVFLSAVIISYIYSQKENEDESKLMKYNDLLFKEANTDQLTGLGNRRYAIACLEGVKKTSYHGAISVCMADIDHFKKVNDTYGHDAGDEVLKAVAEALKKGCGDRGIASRWGGEEFLLIFTGVNGDDAFMLIESLRSRIQNMNIKTAESDIKVTMTFGLTEYDFSGDMEKTIKEADEKLYIGKTGGRNKVIY